MYKGMLCETPPNDAKLKIDHNLGVLQVRIEVPNGQRATITRNKDLEVDHADELT
jgi:hypothetical protein